MANVLFTRKNASEIPNVPITDGQLIFDTSGTGKMYLDNGMDRLEMGGAMNVDSTLSKTSTNPIQNKAVAGVMLENLTDIDTVTTSGFLTDALATKELHTEVNELNSNLNGFSFTTQDSKDGYMKDGTFHPFGDPYLRYNEDTGYIQTLAADGIWLNIYKPYTYPVTDAFDGNYLLSGVVSDYYLTGNIDDDFVLVGYTGGSARSISYTSSGIKLTFTGGSSTKAIFRSVNPIYLSRFNTLEFTSSLSDNGTYSRSVQCGISKSMNEMNASSWDAVVTHARAVSGSGTSTKTLDISSLLDKNMEQYYIYFAIVSGTSGASITVNSTISNIKFY